MSDIDVAAYLSNKIYEKLEVGVLNARYQVLSVTKDNLSSGYYGAIILDTYTNTNYLVSRGTEPDTFNDLSADLNLAFGSETSQFSDAQRFLETYNQNSNHIPVTVAIGHSLGGYLSQGIGIVNNFEVITFGSPGAQAILNNLATDYGYASRVTNYTYSKIINIIDANDAIGNYGTHLTGAELRTIHKDGFYESQQGQLFSAILTFWNSVSGNTVSSISIGGFGLAGQVAGSAALVVTKEGLEILYHHGMDGYADVDYESVIYDRIYKIESKTYTITITDSFNVEHVVEINPATTRLLLHDARMADFISNGTIVSQTTSVVNLYGTQYDSIATVRQRNGEQEKITELTLRSGAPVPANGIHSQLFVEEKNANGDFYVAREMTSFIDQAGRIHNILEYRYSEDGNWMVQESIYDPATQTSSPPGPLYVVPSTDLLQTLQFTGATAGSLLGNQLADGNAYKEIVYSAFFKTVGQHFGTFVSYLAVDNSMHDSLDVALNGGSINGTIFENPLFSESFLGNLQASLSSSLANLIVDEVGDVLGIEGTVAGEVFDVVGTTVTTGLVSAGIDILFHNLDGSLYTGILAGTIDFSKPMYNPGLDPTYDPDVLGPHLPNTTVGDYIQYQIASAVGAYVGGRLAGEVIDPESQMAAIFGSMGSALGTAMATGTILAGNALSTAFASMGWVGGPIGAAVGAFIGSIAGTALGNMFGGEAHPSAFANVGYNAQTDLYVSKYVVSNDGGPEALSQSMANAVINGINDILAATGGSLRHTAVAPDLQIGWREGTFYVNVTDGVSRSFGSAGDAIEYAALYTLKNFDLVGGHAVVMRAWHNSEAETLQDWKEDIEVAEAFQLYLTNPTGILAMMMDQPDSALAQSWAKILQRAAELELHLPHERDIDGGWNEVLLARGILDPSQIPNIEGDNIVLTDPVTGAQTILHHVIGPGYEIVRIEGTDGNDIIEVHVNGPSITYVDAGAGNDIIEGSDQRDIILGGSGDDVINGNDGDDWINGGTGEDTIHGNGGLDLIYGGDDNDLLLGDEDGDAIYGGLGDDNLQGHGGNDELFGGVGNDILDGGIGANTLKGEAGDDVLYGTGYGQLEGGSGNDTYYMGGYSDRVEIKRGDGHDVVYGNSTSLNIIEFDMTIGPNELWYEAVGTDLLIKILGEDQSVLIKDIFNVANPSKFVFEAENQMRIDGNETGIQSSNTYIWKEAHLNAQYAGQNGYWQAPQGQYNYMSNENIVTKANIYQTWVAQNVIPSWVLNPYGSLQGWRNLQPDLKYFGTTGNDSYQIHPGGDYGGDWVNLGAGNDIVAVPHTYAYSTFDYLYGDSGDDNLDGGYGNDLIVGGLGNDTIEGNGGNDTIYGGYGDDTLRGQDSEDIIYGGTGNDTILGQTGNDILFGGSGNDILIDYQGNNTLYGEDGDDILRIDAGTSQNLLDGGSGNDTLTGNTGNDQLYGGTGNDTLNGGGGNDFVYGEDGNDALVYTLSENITASDIYDGGNDNDKITINLTAAQFAQDNIQKDLLRLRERMATQQTSDIFTFTAFALSLSNVEAMEIKVDGVVNNIVYTNTNGTVGVDSLNGTSVHDHIKGQDGGDIINGNAGQDYLEGGAGNDVINGGDGFDGISGGADNDTMTGGNGDDDIHGDDGNDSVSGDSGNDILYGDAGNDNVIGGIGDDTLYGGTGDDILTGSDGNDKIYGDSGNDTLTGGIGNDLLDGGSGNDILEGGVGNDTLKGELGDDEYRFALGDGQDTIDDSSGAEDIIRFGAGITRNNISFSLNQDGNLKISFSSNPNDSITIVSPVVNNAHALSIEKLVFSDNSQLNLHDAFSLNKVNDQVTTGKNIPVVINALANDNDFSGVTLSITNLSNPTHGTVLLNANGTVTYTPVTNYYGTDSFTYTAKDWTGHTAIGTVSVTIDDGIIHGTSGADTLNGTSANDTIDGGAGNDIINASAGTDTSYGAAGNDTLYGNGSDILIGGLDNDIYNVSGGSNIITINRGDGVDTVYGNASATNIIRFGDDISPFELWYEKTGNDLLIKIMGEAQSVLVKDVFIQGSRFTIQTTDGDLQMSGTNGYHYINSNTWSDAYLGRMAYSNQVDAWQKPTGIENYETDANLLAQYNQMVFWGGTTYGKLALPYTYGWLQAPSSPVTTYTAANVSGNATGVDYFSGTTGNDTINSTGGNDVAYGWIGNDTITGSVTIMSNDKFYGDSGNDTIKGGAGDDLLVGGLGIDNLYGQAGNDILVGGADADTFVFDQNTAGSIDTIRDFSMAEGDKIQLTDILVGYDPAVNTVSDYASLLTVGSSMELYVDRDGSGTFYSSQKIAIIENTSLTLSSISAGPLGAIYGTNVGETIVGTSGNDTIYGLGGNDTINASAGTDTSYGGLGNDILYGNGSDILIGGKGNDTYYATTGSANIINIVRGDGNDTVYGNTSGANIIRFGDDISPFELWYEKTGNDLMIKIMGEDQSVLVKDVFVQGSRFTIQTTDGDLQMLGTNGYHYTNSNTWGDAYLGRMSYSNQVDPWQKPTGTENYETDANLLAQYNQMSSWGGATYGKLIQPYTYGWLFSTDSPVTVYTAANQSGTATAVNYFSGTTGNDTITSSGGHDVAYGWLGNDVIISSATGISHDKFYGDSGNDTLKGGTGDDLLVGGLGADNLYGESGIDILIGGADADTFFFGQNAFGSVDTIKDFSLAEGDKLNIHDILSGYDPLTSAITDFVQISNSGANSIVSIDSNGGGDNFVQVARLLDIINLTDEQALVTSGNLIV